MQSRSYRSYRSHAPLNFETSQPCTMLNRPGFKTRCETHQSADQHREWMESPGACPADRKTPAASCNSNSGVTAFRLSAEVRPEVRTGVGALCRYLAPVLKQLPQRQIQGGKRVPFHRQDRHASRCRPRCYLVNCNHRQFYWPAHLDERLDDHLAEPRIPASPLRLPEGLL